MAAAASVGHSEATRALHFALGYAGGFVPVWFGERENPLSFVDKPEHLEEIALMLALHEQRGAAGLSEPHRFNGGPTESTVLWAWTDSGKSARYAKHFRPAPSIVLRVGNTVQRLLLWLLSEPIHSGLVERCNKRLAYRIRAGAKLAAPEALRVPLPGTVHGRHKIECTRLTLDDCTASDLVGELRDPPPPWRPTANDR